MTNKQEIQSQIDNLAYKERSSLSDGYHSFSELYAHRIHLFIALCKNLPSERFMIFKAKKHYDGTSYDGWFLQCIINKQTKEQISYHLPISYWDSSGAVPFVVAPCEFDGHSSEDIVQRLIEWF